MKITPEQIQNDTVTLTEALKRLKDAPKDELYVVLQRLGKEGYLIPLSFVSMLVGNQEEGMLYENRSEGMIRQGITPTRDYQAGAIPAVVADADWMVYGIDVEIQVGAVAGARNVQIQAWNLPTLLPSHPGGIYQILTTAIALVATDYGGVYMGHGPNHWTNINNVPAIQADENPLPRLFTETSVFSVLCPGLLLADETTLTVWHQPAD